MSQERPSRPVRTSVAEKRRASERLKEEPASKRRVSTPKIEKPKRKATPIAASDTPVKEDIVIVLPTKVVEGKPLPSLKEPQSNTLSDSEYQSIAESGVLAASVARSRQKWLHDGFFEKYWSKAVYRSKKSMTEGEKKAEAEGKAQGKAPRPTMTKAGTCKMIVEPHVFDVTLYTVKDPAPQPQQFVPYGPPYVSPATPASAYNSSPFRHPPLQQAPGAASQQAPSTPSQQAVTRPPPQNSHQAPPASNTPTSVTATTQKGSATAKQSTSSPKSQSQTQQQRPDPVIHMLAQRAATDQELKAVMTIVATGKASAPQLEFFQKHIDELTKIARTNEEAEARKRAAAAAAAAATTTKTTTAARRQTPPASPTTALTATASAPASASAPAPAQAQTPAPAPATQQQQQPSKDNQQMPKSAVTSPSSTPSSSQQYRPPAIQNPQPPPVAPLSQHPRPPHPNQYTYQHTTSSKPPRAPPTPLHVLLEFAANPVDRFLFPRYSILEYLPGFRSCLASFLVVRKIKASSSSGPGSGSGYSTPSGGVGAGKDASDSHGGGRKKVGAGKKEEEKEEEREVYQPVTVRFRAGDTHTLGILAKVVAPLEEARAYMDGVMSRCERAEEGFLALRLPRKKGGVGVDGVEE